MGLFEDLGNILKPSMNKIVIEPKECKEVTLESDATNIETIYSVDSTTKRKDTYILFDSAIRPGRKCVYSLVGVWKQMKVKGNVVILHKENDGYEECKTCNKK